MDISESNGRPGSESRARPTGANRLQRHFETPASVHEVCPEDRATADEQPAATFQRRWEVVQTAFVVGSLAGRDRRSGPR